MLFSNMQLSVLSQDNKRAQTFDISALVSYRTALLNNVDAEQAYNDCMKNTSAWAQQIAR